MIFNNLRMYKRNFINSNIQQGINISLTIANGMWKNIKPMIIFNISNIVVTSHNNLQYNLNSHLVFT